MRVECILAVTFSVALGLVSPVKAQSPSLADTVYLVVEDAKDTNGAPDGELVIDVFLSLNSGNMVGALIGITWDRHFTRATPEGTIPYSTSDWQFDSLVYQGSFASSPIWLAPPPIDTRSDSLGIAIAGGVSFTSGIPPGSDQLMARLYLSLAPGNSWGPGDEVTIDTSFAPPSGDYLIVIAGTAETGLLPMFLGAKVVPFLPTTCCATPGDYNDDGTFNIADVTEGINRIFLGGAEAPPCQDQADSNGDSAFNISDIVYDITVIFSAGPPPICRGAGS